MQYSYVQPFAAGITQVGVIAGNHDPSGNNNPPPFTARVDYFYNDLAHPPTATTTTPRLSVTRSGNNLVISWPASATGYALQATASLTNPSWSAVSATNTVVGSQETVTLPIGGGASFYRLKK